MILYAAFDRTNYFRWGSVDLEDMVKLPTNQPLLLKYMPATNGGGGVQVKERSVIGNARQKQFIAE